MKKQMPSSATRTGGKEAKPTKRVAPRERDVVTPLTPEQLEQAQTDYRREAGLYKNPDMNVGFDLGIRILSATIDQGEIRIMAVVTGQVVRPEQYAVARGVAQEFKIPAKIVVNEGVDD